MSDDAREMYRSNVSEIASVQRNRVRAEIARRKAVSHNHKDDEVCPVPGCPSVTKPRDDRSEVF